MPKRDPNVCDLILLGLEQEAERRAKLQSMLVDAQARHMLEEQHRRGLPSFIIPPAPVGRGER